MKKTPTKGKRMIRAMAGSTGFLFVCWVLLVQAAWCQCGAFCNKNEMSRHAVSAPDLQPKTENHGCCGGLDSEVVDNSLTPQETLPANPAGPCNCPDHELDETLLPVPVSGPVLVPPSVQVVFLKMMESCDIQVSESLSQSKFALESRGSPLGSVRVHLKNRSIII
jgi:hypothetical protein